MPFQFDGPVAEDHSGTRSLGSGDPAYSRNFLQAQLREGRIQAWFQPKWRLKDGAVIGAEALARWIGPEGCAVAPSDFLRHVRHHGLEREFLFRMLDDAISAHVKWRGLGSVVPVSVNLPPPLLDDIQLADELHQRVVAGGVAPEQICFELLEDEAASLTKNYCAGATRLRMSGFGLALDDFGRGYSSLYNLISAPFTELKIDRAFVSGSAQDCKRLAALFSSVRLGKQLGLVVTAEGIETVEELDVLRRVDCDCGQGYLVAPALRSDDFRDLLAGPKSPAPRYFQ